MGECFTLVITPATHRLHASRWYTVQACKGCENDPCRPERSVRTRAMPSAAQNRKKRELTWEERFFAGASPCNLCAGTVRLPYSALARTPCMLFMWWRYRMELHRGLLVTPWCPSWRPS